MVTDYVPTDETTGPRYPLLLTTGRILSHYNVSAQTRRTANTVWQPEDVLKIHPTASSPWPTRSPVLGFAHEGSDNVRRQ